MSCWRTYTCDVLKDVDKDTLKKAFEGLGYGLDDSNHKIKSFEGSAECDAVITKDGKALSLGIVYDDGTGHVRIDGDYWNTGIDHNSFVGILSREYMKINTIATAELNGWTVEDITLNTEGSYVIACGQYA